MIDWGLFRRGELDKDRHNALVRRAIRERLNDLISKGDLAIGPQGKVRIPVHELREHRFRYADPGSGGGSATPRPGKGEAIGRLPGKGDRGEGGYGHGEGFFEVEVGIQEVADVLFEGLELPNLREVDKRPQPSDDEEYEGLNRRGPMSMLDVRRTLVENIRRHAVQGEAKVGDFSQDDLRFRTLVTTPQHLDQVVLMMIRDSSGSMGEWRRNMSRLLGFWTLQFLKRKYQTQVEVVYILHDSSAELVDEHKFFHFSFGGGTAISSGYKMMADLIQDKYPPSAWNIYAMHFTDGENYPNDNDVAINILKTALPDLNLFCYCGVGEVDEWRPFSHALRTSGVSAHPACEIQVIAEDGDVIRAIRHFFRPRGNAA